MNLEKLYKTEKVVHDDELNEPIGDEEDRTILYPVNSTSYKPIHYYCPNCNETYCERVKFSISSTTENINYNLYTWRTCDKCGDHTVEIDSQIIDVIVKLNKMGLKTEYCCEGHGFGDPPYISFDHSINHLLCDIEPPHLWKFDDGEIYDTVVASVTSCSDTELQASIIVDSVEDLTDRSIWFAYNIIPLAHEGMKVAVYDGNRYIIYWCEDPKNLVWKTVLDGEANSENLVVRSWGVKNKCLRTSMPENPEDLIKIYGAHFGVYKNTYLNALRVWVDNIETYLLDKYKG